MSADHTEDEWHLTPRGWVEGTCRIYRRANKIIERPSDCCETLVRDMTQSYSMAPEVIEWKCIWTSPDYTEEEREALKAKYPRPKY